MLILIGDDDAFMLEMMKDMLEREGHTVLETNMPDTLYQLAVENEADLVISDYDYGMWATPTYSDGLEVLLAIREAKPELRLLLSSGLTRPEAARYGIDAVIKGSNEFFEILKDLE